MLSKIVKTQEFVVFLILVALSLIVGLINPAFFSISTVFDTLRAAIVYFIMAFGVLPIIIAGGIDISFVAIAAVTSFSTHMLLLKLGYEGGTLLYYIIASAMGLLAGLLNGFLVTRFNLPVFNVSLATFTMWYGFNLFFIGATANFDLPAGTVGYYARFLITARDPFVGETGLHISILYVIVIGLAIWWMLKYTTIGRGIYAIGGNREVAIRSGFNVQLIMLVTFAIMGVLSAIAGVTQAFLSRYFNPVIFIGQPLDVLAAIILGGASITGGRGTVIGTALGVILIQVINRALILTGIPVQWQRLVVGLILIVFTTIPAIRERQLRRMGHTTETSELV
ncbi:MAG: ABC transporter permease [Anaerolineae bacterium]|nr:ABC transporter permease [Anaerolineae bacterium]MDW8100716.1 ABC transporter permease [Anaerolineae bacterium]